MTIKTNLEVASGELTPLPGNSRVYISHGAIVHPDFRGKGFGTKAHKERLLKLREMEASYVICTVNAKNAAQIRILEKFGWKKLDEWFDECNCETIHLYGRNPHHLRGLDRI